MSSNKDKKKRKPGLNVRLLDEDEELETSKAVKTSSTPSSSPIEKSSTAIEPSTSSVEEARRRAQPYVQTVGEAEDLAAANKEAAKIKSQQNMANAIGSAATMVGQTIDPEQEGVGGAISGAAQGAAIGTTVAPGYGTAIGAAIGLGLGVISSEQRRKANQAKRDAKAAEIMAQGLQAASQEMTNIPFRFGTSGRNPSSFSAKRNLK